MFMLFLWDQYYPSGGFNDYRGSFDTLDEALAEASKSSLDHYMVVVGFMIVEDGYIDDLKKAA